MAETKEETGDSLRMTRLEKHQQMSALDWTQPNCVIADKTGRSSSTICKWRKNLKKPESLLRWAHRNTQANWEKQFGHLDFVNNRDVDLARQIGMTRERMRQMRRNMNKPKGRFFGMHGRHIEFIKALRADKKNHVGYLRCKEKFPWLRWKLYLKLTRLAGLIPDNKPPPRLKPGRAAGFSQPFDKMDWRLSNVTLAEIWSVNYAVVASARSRQNRRWKKKLSESTFEAACLQQKEAALKI